MRIYLSLLFLSFYSCCSVENSTHVFDVNDVSNSKIDNELLYKQYPSMDSLTKYLDCLQLFRNGLNKGFHENGVEWKEVTRCEMDLFISESGSIDYVGFSFNQVDKIDSTNRELFLKTVNSYIDSCYFCDIRSQNYSLSSVFYFNDI